MIFVEISFNRQGEINAWLRDQFEMICGDMWLSNKIEKQNRENLSIRELCPRECKHIVNQFASIEFTRIQTFLSFFSMLPVIVTITKRSIHVGMTTFNSLEYSSLWIDQMRCILFVDQQVYHNFYLF